MPVEVEDLVKHERPAFRHRRAEPHDMQAPALLGEEVVAGHVALRILAEVGSCYPEQAARGQYAPYLGEPSDGHKRRHVLDEVFGIDPIHAVIAERQLLRYVQLGEVTGPVRPV